MASPWRLFWLLVLACHTVAASAWWWLMPGGFPPSHPRFWSNGVAPIAVLVVVATAVSVVTKTPFRPATPYPRHVPDGLGGGSLGGTSRIPDHLRTAVRSPSARRRSDGGGRVSDFPPTGGLAAPADAGCRRRRRLDRGGLPLSQQAPAPDTRPLNSPMPEVVADPVSVERLLAGMPNSRLRVHPGDGSLTVKAGIAELDDPSGPEIPQPIARWLLDDPGTAPDA